MAILIASLSSSLYVPLLLVIFFFFFSFPPARFSSRMESGSSFSVSRIQSKVVHEYRHDTEDGFRITAVSNGLLFVKRLYLPPPRGSGDVMSMSLVHDLISH